MVIIKAVKSIFDIFYDSNNISADCYSGPVVSLQTNMADSVVLKLPEIYITVVMLFVCANVFCVVYNYYYY